MGCEFKACMCYNKNAIGEEGNGKPPHKIHFPRKNSEPCLWFPAKLKIKYAFQYTYSYAWLIHTPILKPIDNGNSEHRLWFLLRSESSMQHSFCGISTIKV